MMKNPNNCLGAPRVRFRRDFSLIFGVLLCLSLSTSITATAFSYEEDIHSTPGGDLKITFVGHGTLMFEFNQLVIHVDPVARYADYSQMPRADLILVTHDHGDHLDGRVIQDLIKEGTVVVMTARCRERVEVKGTVVMENGDVSTLKGIRIDAVPAYNLQHMRSTGVPYHPRGIGNGYILTIGGKRVYVAGDTENTPEMKTLQNIDIAFLPMNLPYTMSPEMLADAAKAFKPRVLYPYHYGDSDTSKLIELLRDSPEIELRIRKMQ